MEFQGVNKSREIEKGRIEISQTINPLRQVQVNRLLYDVFLICPVRNQTPKQTKKIQKYIENLEDSGKRVYYPARDTDQIDTIGFRICFDNREAIAKSKEVHLWFDRGSEGSKFDLGMAWSLQKTLVIANEEEVKQNVEDIYCEFILRWNNSPQGFERLARKKGYDVFMIYPTRNQTEEFKQKIESFVRELEEEGKTVFYPRTTEEQENPITYATSYNKRLAIESAKEVRVWYDGQCKEILFDLGMAWGLQKPLKAINIADINSTPSKSFDNVIREWNK